MLIYVAVNKNKDNIYGVSVPALPGCFSSGETIEEALKNTKDAIKFYIEESLKNEDQPTIKKVSLDKLQADPDYKGANWFGLDIELSN